MILRVGLCSAAAALLFYCAPAAAQDFRVVAPKQPPSQAPAPAVAPPSPTPALTQDPQRQLLPELKGLRLVPRPEMVVRTGLDRAGLSIENLPRLDVPVLRARLGAFLGKPLRAGDLTSISRVIIDYYRNQGLPVVDVVFPEQDIDSGTVQVLVTEYRLGQIKVSGNRWFSTDMLRSEVSVTLGGPVDFDILRQDLNRLNANPFHSVTAVVERSDVPGNIDLGLRVDDRFPLRLYASFDNDGLPVTGRDRYSAGINWGDLFGLDQQVSYQFSTSPDLWRDRNRGAGLSDDPRFLAHSFTYEAPLPWGDRLDVFGSAVEQVPDLGANFGQVGHSVQLSLRYTRQLPYLGDMSQQVRVGFDHKRTDSNLAFGGTQIFTSATNVDQFLLDYGATRPDSYGQTALENTLTASPGGLSSGNSTARFLASGVVGANATYVYDTLAITRLTNLPWDLSWMASVSGQIASTELLPSEQLGAGGTGSVRGYDMRTASGSDGVTASTELRSPAYSLLGDLGGFRDQAQLLAFYDYAHVFYKNNQPQLPSSAELQSLGFGLRYQFGRLADIRFDYGWQLERAPGAAGAGNLASISVTLGY